MKLIKKHESPEDKFDLYFLGYDSHDAVNSGRELWDREGLIEVGALLMSPALLCSQPAADMGCAAHPQLRDGERAGLQGEQRQYGT